MYLSHGCALWVFIIRVCYTLHWEKNRYWGVIRSTVLQYSLISPVVFIVQIHMGKKKIRMHVLKKI